MLVMERHFGQSVRIGSDIIVYVFEPKRSGQGVRIGVEAPQAVNVARAEVYDPDKAAAYAETHS